MPNKHHTPHGDHGAHVDIVDGATAELKPSTEPDTLHRAAPTIDEIRNEQAHGPDLGATVPAHAYVPPESKVTLTPSETHVVELSAAQRAAIVEDAINAPMDTAPISGKWTAGTPPTPLGAKSPATIVRE